MASEFDDDGTTTLDDLTVKFALRTNDERGARDYAVDPERRIGYVEIDLWELSVDGVGESKLYVRKITLKQNRFELREEDLGDRGVTIWMQLSGVSIVKAWWPHRFIDPVVLCNCLHRTVELSGWMYVVFDITIYYWSYNDSMGVMVFNSVVTIL